MREKLNIPEKIKVGFQSRGDTYTKRLAFVVYYDKKNKLRQERSWNGWRDEKIEPEDYDNEPMSGFVLNRDVGGSHRSYGWNARREKVRVYDPRDFEVEITVDNLLFILQECSSIKGKGLEGEFVYGWSGTSLVLIPTHCEEYKKSTEYTDLQERRVYKKDMEAGCTYTTHDNVNVMYLGRLDWHEFKYDYDLRENYFVCYKKHIFLNMDGKDEYGDKYYPEKGFTKLAVKTSDKPLESFADAFEAYMNSEHASVPKKMIFESKMLEDFFGVGNDRHYPKSASRKNENGEYEIGTIYRREDYQTNKTHFEFNAHRRAVMDNGRYVEKPADSKDKKWYGYSTRYDEIDVTNESVGHLYIELENGAKVKRS